MAKIKVSSKSLAKFKSKNIVKIATDFVKGSIEMGKVRNAIKATLDQHPEIADYNEVIAARILAQSLLYTIFGNKNLILWKDAVSRSEMAKMRKCSVDMFYNYRK